jgi:probable rRNA maturation factor
MAKRAARLEISVAAGLERRAPRRADLERWVEAAFAVTGRSGVVSVRLMDDEEMRVLNRGFRGQDKATNVLSFPAESPAGAPGADLLGDLALCVPVVEREAQEHGKTAAAHYAHLVVHGVLHLLGWDHEDDDEAAAMEAKEVEILATLGIGDPYRIRAAS